MARYENAKNATPNWPHADQNGVPVSRDNTDGGYWDNNNNNDNNEWSWSPGVDSLSRLKSMEANKGFSSSGGSTFDTHGGSTIGTHGESTIANQKEYPEWHAPEAGLEAVNVGAPPVSQAKQTTAPEWHQAEAGLEVGEPVGKSAGKKDKKQDGTPVGTSIWNRGPQPYSNEKIYVDPNKKILGLRRRTFWLILACAIILVLAIVLGVALGLTLGKKTSDETAAMASSPSSSAIETITVGSATVTITSVPSSATTSLSASSTTSTSAAATTTASSTTSSGTQPTPTLNAMPSCPDANGTTYTDPVTNVEFSRECGISHTGSDIINREAYSMDDCVTMCAQISKCGGAVWFNDGAQGTLLNYCWLKTAMNGGDDILYNNDAQSVTRL